MAKKTVGFGMFVILVVIILVLIGGMGYLFYKENPLSANNQSIASMSKEIATQNATILEQTSAISSLELELNLTVANLQSEINQLKGLINSLENYTNSSGQNQTNSSVPLSATLQEQTETGTTVTVTLSYTTPVNMSDLNDVGLLLSIPGTSGTTYISFKYITATTGPITFTGNGNFNITIVNPSGNTTYLESGAIIQVTYSGTNPSTVSWSGYTLQLTYKGYSGAASVTLP